MKPFFTIFLLFFGLFLQAQNTNSIVRQGGYFTEEIGGNAPIPTLSLDYEYIKPLNEKMFLSTRVGANCFVGLTGYDVGVPHGVSLNFGKKHFYFETGLNGWYGFTQDDDAGWQGEIEGFSYIIGVNLGLNTVFAMKKRNVMYRIYLNPWYNTTSNNGLIRQTFIWGGMGCSIQLHN